MAGGPGSIVMRSSGTRSITVGTSKTGWGRIVAPLKREARIPAFSPKAWKKGLMIR